MRRSVSILCLVLMITAFRCEKDASFPQDPEWRYFEVGIRDVNTENWRDSSFVVATKNPAVLERIAAQLALPVAERNKHVAGGLAKGHGGYNKNSSHYFSWHLKEDDWDLVDVSVEVTDGRPYTDVDRNYAYWMNTLKRFTPWGSYIKREIMK